MRTSLIETEQIEAYLLQTNDAGSKLLFDARLILEPDLQENTLWQQKAYDIVRLYGRKQLKHEIESTHQKLFNMPEHDGFRQKIKRLFKKK